MCWWSANKTKIQNLIQTIQSQKIPPSWRHEKSNVNQEFCKVMWRRNKVKPISSWNSIDSLILLPQIGEDLVALELMKGSPDKEQDGARAHDSGCWLAWDVEGERYSRVVTQSKHQVSNVHLRVVMSGEEHALQQPARQLYL